MKKIIYLLILLICSAVSQAQDTRIVSGKVVILNDLPVSGISVKAQKSGAAVKTDSLGNFVIACQSGDKLVVESECFNTTKVKITSKVTDTVKVKISFTPNEKKVDMAIGYGYISEDLRTQAIGKLDKSRDYSSYLTIYDVIRANFNGIYIRPDHCIQVRGIGTISTSGCAVYVVNGQMVDNIDFISPNDVKDISLLKDGSAAIYGSQSGNGVFIINLKDGKE